MRTNRIRGAILRIVVEVAAISTGPTSHPPPLSYCCYLAVTEKVLLGTVEEAG